MSRALWTGGIVLGAVAVVGGLAWAFSRKEVTDEVSVTLSPGTVHVPGYKPGYSIGLVLPSGAKWGGVTDSVAQPSGTDTFWFGTLPSETTGSIGATWWDAHGVAQATTVIYSA